MRELLLIAAACALLGAVGCATEEEQRREKQADREHMWDSVDYMPDKILELGEWAPHAPAPSKPPLGTTTAPVVQVSASAKVAE